MNGNLVALCSVNPNLVRKENSEERRYFLNRNRDPLECFGYGLIRSIDFKENIVYIVTPLDLELHKESMNCLIVAGSVGVPNQFYTNGLEDLSNAPYVMDSREFSSKLNISARKSFTPKKITHRVVKNTLL